MDKREFIFPGIVLGLVIIVALGLLATTNKNPQLIPTNIASSTASSTISSASSTMPESGKPSTSPSKPSGGGSPGITSYYPYGRVSLAMNQVAGFKDGLEIRPVAVVEDSRCPADVQCIQAGTVRISLKESVGDTESYQTIELGKNVMLNGDTVTLTEVTPARTTGGNPAQSSYHFVFTVTRGSVSTSGSGPCYIGGCSSQLCTDSADAISNCMYNAQYACYRTAKCERQTNGSCGWTETPELARCLANPSAI